MMSGHLCPFHKIAWLLVMIGAINWGLVGIGSFMGSNWNLVSMIFGTMPSVEAAIYVLVGLSAVSFFFGCKKCDETCGMDMK